MIDVLVSVSGAVALTAGLGLASAILLFLTLRRFALEIDPRLARVEAVLPGINCGSCGQPGCSAFAQAAVRASSQGSLGELYCPPGGPAVMDQLAEILGLTPTRREPTVAVLRCGGSLTKAPERVRYLGPPRCALAHNLSAGPSLCPYGCLRLGDCVTSCDYGALVMDAETGLPRVLPEKCISCGACVRACPRGLFALLPRGRKDRRVWVACRNREVAALALKICKAACIACGKCASVCPVEAITVENNLATIDPVKCIACGKCVPVCPTGAIQSTLPQRTAPQEVSS